MHISTISDQTDHTKTGPLTRYDGANSDEYLSNSDSYNNNDSDCGSDDYNNYEFNYELDSEEAPCASSSTTKTSLVQLPNKIFLSPPRDILNDKESLDCLLIYLFLFPNKKGPSLYNAYNYNEVEDKLVIKIDQDNRASKFSIADDIAEVYSLLGIHECINDQNPLRAVIDIDALALYRILDCGWKDILKELVIATFSDPSKCSYHILYALAFLIDYHELKAFTDLLIGSAKKGCIKCIFQFLLDNGWNELDHVRVQPPFNLGFEDILQKCMNLVLQKHSKYLRDWTIEEKDSQSFVNELEEIFEYNLSIVEKILQKNKILLQPSHKLKGSGFSRAFVKIPSWVKYSETLTTTKTYKERYIRQLPNEGNIYVGSP
ncbi:16711_t:CDS:2 [Cetraspora pellucida]|uniref:16711_t:CDS:1 n=1 Tax=Cetraspora pellucida TaxID=1433469 RepID=A0A9N9D795_9GLOM|nr:16711_t:CDS:2 [Cetraspora pellucida]